jgi:hypothetical protein
MQQTQGQAKSFSEGDYSLLEEMKISQARTHPTPHHKVNLWTMEEK